MKNPEQKASEKKNEPLRYLPLVILIVITLFGFYLRIYHIDYPVIGYHNWKETHYITEARNFARDGFFKYGFFVPVWNYPSLYSNPVGTHSDTFPLTPILVAIAFWIFGMNLTVARIIGVLFVVATIPLMYLITKRVFKKDDLALASAAITAMLPLTVFFSHNVELINPGLFLFTLSVYMFLKWMDENKPYQLILTSLSFMIAAITKYDFFAMGLLFVLIFPFRRVFKEIKTGKIFTYLISALILLSFFAWYVYSNETVARESNTEKVASPEQVNYLDILNASSWISIEPYFSDSWTIIGTYLAFFGALLAALTFLRKREFPEKFLLSLLIASIVYFSFMFFKIKGHSYHMYPMALFFIISISYLITKISDFSSRLKVEGKGVPYLNFLIMMVLLAGLFLPMKDSAGRQFDTQFYGLDVAGEYIKEHKETADERVMHSTNQAYGILWHGDIKGTRGIPDTIEKFKFAEENLTARWLFIYNWDFQKVMENKELWAYIKANYGLRQFAFIQTQQGAQTIYLLFRKGGTFDENNLNTLLSGKPQLTKDYELTMGKVRLSYINID